VYKVASEKTTEKYCRAQGSSDANRRGAGRGTAANRVHRAAVVRGRASRGLRGWFWGARGPHGVPPECTRCEGSRGGKGADQWSAGRRSRAWRQSSWRGSRTALGQVATWSLPTDPAGIRPSARGLRTWSAAKKHTDEGRGGRRDPGVRRPGAGRGQLPALNTSSNRH